MLLLLGAFLIAPSGALLGILQGRFLRLEQLLDFLSVGHDIIGELSKDLVSDVARLAQWQVYDLGQVVHGRWTHLVGGRVSHLDLAYLLGRAVPVLLVRLLVFALKLGALGVVNKTDFLFQFLVLGAQLRHLLVVGLFGGGIDAALSDFG